MFGSYSSSSSSSSNSSFYLNRLNKKRKWSRNTVNGAFQFLEDKSTVQLDLRSRLVGSNSLKQLLTRVSASKDIFDLLKLTFDDKSKTVDSRRLFFSNTGLLTQCLEKVTNLTLVGLGASPKELLCLKGCLAKKKFNNLKKVVMSHSYIMGDWVDPPLSLLSIELMGYFQPATVVWLYGNSETSLYINTEELEVLRMVLISTGKEDYLLNNSLVRIFRNGTSQSVQTTLYAFRILHRLKDVESKIYKFKYQLESTERDGHSWIRYLLEDMRRSVLPRLQECYDEELNVT